MTVAILENLIYLLTAVIGLIPLFYKVTKERELNEKKSFRYFIKRIRFAGWVVIILAIGTIVLGIWRDNLDEENSKRKNKQLVDQVGKRFDSSLNRVGLTLDSNGNVVSNKPFLGIYQSPAFDFTRKNGNNIPIYFAVKNWKSGSAKGLSMKVITIFEDPHGNLIIPNPVTEDTLHQVIIPSQQFYSFNMNYEISLNNIKNGVKSYVYFRLNYTDELGNYQPPLQQIFIIPPPTREALIFDLKGATYKKVQELLSSKGFW